MGYGFGANPNSSDAIAQMCLTQSVAVNKAVSHAFAALYQVAPEIGSHSTWFCLSTFCNSLPSHWLNFVDGKYK